MTARKEFWDQAHDLALARVAALLTPEELEQIRPRLEPAERSPAGKVLSYAVVRREMRFAQFGGLTFHEQWRKMESEIVRNEPPQVHESFTLDRSYEYGIGLHIVLDVEVIDQAAIETAIERLLAIGETDWVAAEAVPRERLPTVSEIEALEGIEWSAAGTGMS